MKITEMSWVDFVSWNLFKEDNKVYEEEVLQIKAKYGDEVTEDQIEGIVLPEIRHFLSKFIFRAILSWKNGNF